MDVIIVGAGEVGRSIASTLAHAHDVAVIDRDEAVAEALPYSLDVLSVQGDGTELGTLREAGLDDADLIIACTDSDETNLVICGTVKSRTDAFTIARVRRLSLLETWQGSQTAFGVDFMVCTDLLTAESIFRISGMPGAHAVSSFAGGLVRMGEFEIGTDCPVAGQTVRTADQYDSLTFAAIFRNGEFVVARGDTEIRPNDRVVVIGSQESVNQFAATLSTSEASTEEVVIVGGSEIGFQTARLFEEQGFSPRLIEQDRDRARELAEELPNTLVLEHDGTDIEFLETEHVDDADLVVAALESDAKNLLVSLLARRVGADRTIAVIESSEYATLFETVGIDVAVNPREKTADEIIRFTRADHTEKVTMLEHDRAEVLELEVREGGVLTGRPIEEAIGDLPEGVVIGAISRGGELVTPRGTTVVEPSDHLVVFVDVAVLNEVTEAI